MKLRIQPIINVTRKLFTLFDVTQALMRYVLWRTLSGLRGKSGFVNNEGDRIHYLCYGKGKPLFFLHGGLSRPLSWFAQLPDLASQGYQLILITTRGHGLSTDRSGHDYFLYAGDVVAVMNALNLPSGYLLGWSDGANTALMLALHWPEKVLRMVLISANFHYSGQSLLTSETLTDNWFRRIWSASGTHFPALQKQIGQLWCTQPVLGVEELTQVDLPVLMITGQFDCIHFDHSQQMASALPQGRLEVIAGAAHAAQITHSRQVNALVIDFLNNNLIISGAFKGL